jgi:hypothetical protein
MLGSLSLPAVSRAYNPLLYQAMRRQLRARSLSQDSKKGGLGYTGETETEQFFLLE